MVTIADLATSTATGKNQEAVRQRIYKARKNGELKKWKRPGGIVLADKQEAEALIKQDGRGRHKPSIRRRSDG